MEQPFAFDFRNNRCHKTSQPMKKCWIPSLALADTAIPILPPAACGDVLRLRVADGA
jgi:hypothetical protein